MKFEKMCQVHSIFPTACSDVVWSNSASSQDCRVWFNAVDTVVKILNIVIALFHWQKSLEEKLVAK